MKEQIFESKYFSLKRLVEEFLQTKQMIGKDFLIFDEAIVLIEGDGNNENPSYTKLKKFLKEN